MSKNRPEHHTAAPPPHKRSFRLGRYFRILQFHRIASWWRRMDGRYRWKWRAANVLAAGLMLSTVVLPVVQELLLAQSYRLSAATQQIIGTNDQKLAERLTYDAKKQAYTFNAEAVKEFDPTALLKNTTGAGGASKKGAQLYALDVAKDLSKGVTYTDTNSQLAFTLKPQYKGRDGRVEQGRLVFPLSSGAQAIYSLKNNGLKEDIVVQKATKDTMQFDYTLDLPKTLEARVIPDGSGAIGIYGPSPTLTGNISYGSDNDRKLVESAREKGEKDTLIFGLPAPVIVTPDGKNPVGATARFALSGTTLSVVAEGLQSIKTSFSVDPSVVVTSTSDFQTNGNNEGMIDFGTAGQGTRSGLTGGTTGAWGTTTALTIDKEKAAMVAYNGYMYVVGGQKRTVASYATVEYAAINANGTLGAWTATTALPAVNGVTRVVTYNGRMYSVGGFEGSSIITDKVYYNTINSNGTLGASWTATTALPVALAFHGLTAYNGYLYVLGGTSVGFGSGPWLNSVYYAPLRADGSVGAWTLSSNSFTNGRIIPGAMAYNGYLYVVGGGSSGYYNDVQYAPIKSDGSIGTWIATSSFTTARYGNVTYIYNGYMYSIAGNAGSTYFTDTQYAQINANGTLGAWATTTSLTGGRTYAAGVAYNGYIYSAGGWNATVNLSEVAYARINPAGTVVSVANSGNTFAATRRGAAVVATQGRLYIIGGNIGGIAQASVYMAAFNADGTIGTFSSPGNLPAGRTFAAAVAANGNYIYTLGGCSSALSSCTTAANDTATVYRGNINITNGTISWGTDTSFATGRYGHAAFVHNGYLYVIGGANGTTVQTDVQYAALPTTGSTSLTGWTASAITAPGRAFASGAVYGDRMYIVGGCGTVTTPGTCSAASNAVSYASFASNGDLAGAFTTGANSLGTARGYGALAVWDGYMYMIGGSSGATYYKLIEKALINTDGTIGPWANEVTTLVGNRNGIGAAVSDGRLYVCGGYDGTTYYQTVQIGAINNGGNNIVGTWVANATTLAAPYPNGISHQGIVAYNGNMYSVGGLITGTTANVWLAPINADGSVGSWTQTSTMNVPRDSSAVTIYHGRLYAIAGSNNGNRLATTEYAPINSDGTLGRWKYTTSTDAGVGAIKGVRAGAYKGYIYMVGGNVAAGDVATVQYAPINSDGSLGTWLVTNTFASARTMTGFAINNGYMYVVGGAAAGVGAEVQFAPINSDGTVGSWTYTTSLPVNRRIFSLTAANGKMVAFGGYSAMTNLGAEVLYADFLPSGRLGAWYQSPGEGHNLTPNRLASGTLVYNGFVYLLGGFNGASTWYTDVKYAPMNVISRNARYSKLIDLGAPANVSSVTTNGRLPLGDDATLVRWAGTDGVLSTAALPSYGTISNACTLKNAGNLTAAQYLFVTVLLNDETGGTTVADAAGTPANATDITVNYGPVHPPPQVRLRHGQTLQQSYLSTMDTCVGP